MRFSKSFKDVRFVCIHIEDLERKASLVSFITHLKYLLWIIQLESLLNENAFVLITIKIFIKTINLLKIKIKNKKKLIFNVIKK